MASDLSLGAGRSQLVFRWHCRSHQFGTGLFLGDGGAWAWTGNLVEPLEPVKWLDLRVRPCPSVSIG